MEFRPLDLKIISATDLKNVNTFSRMDPYVVVSISGDDSDAKFKTPVHNNGGTSPKWDHSVRFVVNEEKAQKNKLTLKFKIKEDGTFNDKEIGEVHVPIKELLDAKNDGGEKVVSYAVRTSSGKSKGTLHFSFKFGDKYTVQNAVPPPQPAMAYPAPPPPHAYGGSTSAYPPPGKSSGEQPPVAYPPYPHPSGSYPQPAQPGYGYPAPPPHPHGAYPYPAQPGYGYPPQPGYGYPPQPGYGYPPVQPPKHKKNGGGFGKMGLGIGAGLLGGLLLGEAVSDVADGVSDAADAFDDGFDVDVDF